MPTSDSRPEEMSNISRARLQAKRTRTQGSSCAERSLPLDVCVCVRVCILTHARMQTLQRSEWEAEIIFIFLFYYS